ncbi:ElaB/YqjD/DUF883 family membrane-anchored ribosome-binding protein [Rhizomicrobium palustre]|uniref:ElaB/YqjD/DUF883 family membrane-anchored ribosome-binding protein n=1 Tax=Rhizomicrobium palustre TaxID=189966 RepID=A0A846N260_9PROT|nr:hypothetical protein [Rhizomicrobium palustre]NIK89217.1 ElaB/YqjD/DUF883 family membrane-anchored ribosome-binding protein [Rhizomicrobium palustre]
MDNQTSGDFEAVKQDVKDLKTDSSALAGHLRNKASDGINGTLGRIEETVSDIWDRVSRTSTQSYEAVERNVEERPMMAVLAAFAIGASVGWLLDRRR